MPITKSAKKALRQSKRKQSFNQKTKAKLKDAFRKALKNPTKETINGAYSKIDKAAKNKVIHPNKANRLKSKIAKVAKKVKTPKSPKKKSSAKKSTTAKKMKSK